MTAKGLVWGFGPHLLTTLLAVLLLALAVAPATVSAGVIGHPPDGPHLGPAPRHDSTFLELCGTGQTDPRCNTLLFVMPEEHLMVEADILNQGGGGPYGADFVSAVFNGVVQEKVFWGYLDYEVPEDCRILSASLIVDSPTGSSTWFNIGGVGSLVPQGTISTFDVTKWLKDGFESFNFDVYKNDGFEAYPLAISVALSATYECRGGHCPPPGGEVPEPTTFFLAGAGLLGLGIARRRRRRQLRE